MWVIKLLKSGLKTIESQGNLTATQFLKDLIDFTKNRLFDKKLPPMFSYYYAVILDDFLEDSPQRDFEAFTMASMAILLDLSEHFFKPKNKDDSKYFRLKAFLKEHSEYKSAFSIDQLQYKIIKGNIKVENYVTEDHWDSIADEVFYTQRAEDYAIELMLVTIEKFYQQEIPKDYKPKSLLKVIEKNGLDIKSINQIHHDLSPYIENKEDRMKYNALIKQYSFFNEEKSKSLDKNMDNKPNQMNNSTHAKL